jgi:branched-subunit amino acid transport protein AzlD
VLFNLLFITLYVLGWLALGFLPWLVLSVTTRGNAGLRYLPLSMGAGVVGGLAVPIFRDDGLGLILSFVVALAFPTLLLTARRASRRWQPGTRG